MRFLVADGFVCDEIVDGIVDTENEVWEEDERANHGGRMFRSLAWSCVCVSCTVVGGCQAHGGHFEQL